MRFSQILSCVFNPVFVRSSGIWAIFFLRIFFGVEDAISSPKYIILPLLAFRKPVRASTSSVCPLPSTPAIPTISPSFMLMSTPFTAKSPRAS